MNLGKMYHAIDAHVAGEAFRIVLHSPIAFQGMDIQANNEKLKTDFETEKNLLLKEPRGHRGMHGCVAGLSDKADLSLLFFNHEHTVAFKYEGILAAVTALVETGNLESREFYGVETVEGVVEVQVAIAEQEVVSASVEGTAAATASLEGATEVCVDGRRNYLLFPLPSVISKISLANLAALNRWGLEKTGTLNSDDPKYEGIIVFETVTGGKIRSVTFEKDGYILRSPGIDTTFALLTSLGGSEIENESVFGSTLSAHVLNEDEQVFKLVTKAFVTGTHEFIFEPSDPLPKGFLLA